MADQRKNDEDTEKAEHDHEWGNVEGQASASTSDTSLLVEKRRHERLYRSRSRGNTNEYPCTTETGCFHDLLHACSNFLHLLYIITGLVLLIYSISIFLNSHAAPQQLWHTFPTILTIWSSLLLLTGSIGLHGLYSPVCRRYGLVISAYFGIALIVWESALVIYVIIEKRSFLEFLRLGEEKFYLTEREIDAFDPKSAAFILVFLALTLAELLRYFMLQYLRSEILTHDDAKIDAQRRDDAQRRGRNLRQWKAMAGSGGGLTLSAQDYDESRTPLLVDDNDDVENDEDKIEVKELASLGHEEYNIGGDGEGVNLQSTRWWVDADSSQDGQEFSSALGFAPIDDDLSMGSEWGNNRHEISQPQTDIGIGESRGEDNDPVLSWVRDDHS